MLSHWGERKTNDISCFRFGSCMYTSVWVWWAYFHGLCAVHQKMVNSTSTPYNGKYMLNPLGDLGALTFIEPVCIFGCWSNRRPPNSPSTRLIARRSARVKAPPGVESIRRRSIFFRYYEHITCPRNEFTLMINYLHLWKAVYDSFTIA